MNFINIFQHTQYSSVSVGNTYSEDQLMHIFKDNFHQVGKYSSQIASHQAELRREVNFTDRKYLLISSLHTDYLDLDRISGSGRNSERAKNSKQSAHFVEVKITLQKKIQRD